MIFLGVSIRISLHLFKSCYYNGIPHSRQFLSKCRSLFQGSIVFYNGQILYDVFLIVYLITVHFVALVLSVLLY